MTKNYWDGAVWVYHVKVTNEGSEGASTLGITITPGRGNEMEVLYGQILNGDSAGRTCIAEIRDSSNQIITRLLNDSVNAAAVQSFPAANAPEAAGGVASAGARYIVAGTMNIHLIVVSAADGQDGSFGIACRIRGAVPAVASEGAGTEVLSEELNQVY